MRLCFYNTTIKTYLTQDNITLLHKLYIYDINTYGIIVLKNVVSGVMVGNFVLRRCVIKMHFVFLLTYFHLQT